MQKKTTNNKTGILLLVVISGLALLMINQKSGRAIDTIATDDFIVAKSEEQNQNGLIGLPKPPEMNYAIGAELRRITKNEMTSILDFHREKDYILELLILPQQSLRGIKPKKE